MAAGPCIGRIWRRGRRLEGARSRLIPVPFGCPPFLAPHPLGRGLMLTGDGSPGRRGRQGTAPGSTCRGSPARRRTCRPQGGSGRESTGSSARSAGRTCARGTGSGRSVARTATCCRRTDCCNCGPTSLRGTGTLLSVGRSVMWRCSSTRWRTACPTNQARSDTRRSAGGTSRAGTGTHARSVLPSGVHDTYTGLSRPRTAREGGRYTAPYSRGPRTGVDTLQGRAKEGAGTHPEPDSVPHPGLWGPAPKMDSALGSDPAPLIGPTSALKPRGSL